MARLARAVVPGIAHHITQRGNHRQDVFLQDDDRSVYLAALGENAARYGVRLLGYCLMTNHVHLIAVPEREESLAKALGRTHADYARWLHIRQRQTGHLWQNRFFSCPLDSGHCWAALRYVERNPLRAGLVEAAEVWPWSSARAHMTGEDAARNLTTLLDWSEWRACWTPARWRDAIEKGVGETLFEERIRQATRTGRPLGANGFAAALERLLRRPLIPAKRGRKPLAKTAQASG
jgi:putative transposase